MDIHCVNGWLFHEWKKGKCKRCGVIYRGTLTDATWGDDPSLFGVPAQDLPVGPASLLDYLRPVGHPLRLVRRSLDEDDSSSVSVATDLAGSKGSGGHL
jgi:hypothetical protein